MRPAVRLDAPRVGESLTSRFSFPRVPTGIPSQVVLWVLVAVTVAAAVGLGQSYAANYRSRWNSPSHDRNAHYGFAASLAAEVRNGHPAGVVRAVDAGSMVWPPFQGLVSAAVLAATGPDVRFSIAPSLIGFVLSAVFAFLLARRVVPDYGTGAGLCAATFVLACPAVRAYATDAMLESLGLGLSLAALYAAVNWAGRRTTRSAVLLGLVLTGLFLQKYNYWLLVVVPLGVVTVGSDLRGNLVRLRSILSSIPWNTWAAAQLRRPLNYVIFALVVLAGVTVLTGGWAVEVGGKTVGMKTPRVVVNVAYGLVLLRFATWWWTGGRFVAARWIGPDGVALVYTHLAPAALWLLWPVRLQSFAWYLSTANSEHVYHDSFGATAEFYRTAAVTEYCTGPAAAGAVVALLAVAALGWAVRALRPGAGLVLTFLVLGAALTLYHPNHKSRFLHTWLPAAFVLAGAGAAVVARAARSAGPAVATLVTLAVLVGVGRHAVGPGRATDCRVTPSGASLLDLTDAYLPELDGAHKPLVLSIVCAPLWVKWTALERWGGPGRVETDFRSIGWFGPVTPDVFAEWLKTATTDVIVYIDVPPTSELYEVPPPVEANPRTEEILRGQAVFRPANEIHVPNRGRIAIWRR